MEVPVIRRAFFAAALALACSAGIVLPASPATAAPNGSQLAQCERSAAERLARRIQNGDRTKARRQFQNDIARCKRRFG
jgi:hypothetical protein